MLVIEASGDLFSWTGFITATFTDLGTSLDFFSALGHIVSVLPF